MSLSETKLILTKDLNFNSKKLELIELFVQEVLNYNQKFNLISKNSEKEIWNRHVLDSAQLVNHIDHKNFNSLADLVLERVFQELFYLYFIVTFSRFT